MSETTTEQQLHMEPDPDGDVVLRYSKLESDTPVSFRVSSKILRLASAVFERMLRPSFREGQELLQDGLVVIELEDDNPSLMGLIMNILHYQADSNVHTIDADKLARLAILCDKYDCTRVLSPWAAMWFAKLEERKPSRPQYDVQLLAAYLFNDTSHFLKISKAAVSELKPSCPMQWPQEYTLTLLPESVSNAVTENIENTLNSMEDELQNAESQLREFHRGHEMDQLACVLCGRTLSEEAKKCHRCRNTSLLQRYCTEETRVAKYFAVLRRVELWPTKGPFEDSSVADIAYRFACAKVELKHNCAAGNSCPLIVVLESLVSRVSKIQGGVKGFCLLCVRQVEDWRHDTKCLHTK